MHVRRALVSVGLAGSIFLGGCTAALPHATAEQVERARAQAPGVTPQSLDQGRTLYQSHCGACHNLYPPTAHRAEQWPQLVDRMKDRAHTDAAQTELITRYLVVTSVP